MRLWHQLQQWSVRLYLHERLHSFGEQAVQRQQRADMQQS